MDPRTASQHNPPEGGPSADQIHRTLVRALALEFLAIGANLFGGWAMAGAVIGAVTYDRLDVVGTWSTIGWLGVPAAWMLAGVPVTIIVIARTVTLLRFASEGDTIGLRRTSSLHWAVVAILFSWFGPGILLARADRALRARSASAPVPSPNREAQSAPAS